MSTERKKLIAAATLPLILLLLMWVERFAESLTGMHFYQLGVYPLHAKGLPGILLMPFVHGGYKHLLANSVPFLVLSVALFYFYRDISFRVLIGIWFLSGLWTWFGGRDAWHIGASGVIYGLSSFLFFSGLIRKDNRLAALALVVAFLYGSMIWGIFPDFFPKKNISWEGHLGGLVAGIILAIYYRKSGPQRKRYSWELEEGEEPGGEDENVYWKTNGKNTNTT